MDFICPHATPWTALVTMCWLLHTIFEWWLGRTEKVKSGSTITLLAVGIVRLIFLFFKPKAMSIDGITIIPIEGDFMTLPIQTVPVQLDVPKEGKEVVDALKILIVDIKAKKAITELASDCLGPIVTAVEGVDGLSDELKSANKADLFAYIGKEIASALGL